MIKRTLYFGNACYLKKKDMQLIIVYSILILTVVLSLYAIIKSIRRKDDPCKGCEFKNRCEKSHD